MDEKEETGDPMSQAEAVATILSSVKNPIVMVVLGVLFGGGIGGFGGFTIGDSADHVTIEQLDKALVQMKEEQKKDTEDVLYVLCLLAGEHDIRTAECAN